MSETTFADGMIIKAPHENCPDFIKHEVSFKVSEFIEFLKKHEDNGWVNVTIKESKNGKHYAQLNDWKPEKKEETATPDDASAIPF